MNVPVGVEAFTPLAEERQKLRIVTAVLQVAQDGLVLALHQAAHDVRRGDGVVLVALRGDDASAEVQMREDAVMARTGIFCLDVEHPASVLEVVVVAKHRATGRRCHPPQL